MKQANQQLPRVRMFRLEGDQLDALSAVDVMFVELGETRLTVPQILMLRNKWFEWRCPIDGCHQQSTFHVAQVPEAPQWIVQHLTTDHELTGEQILNIEPLLKSEVRQELDESRDGDRLPLVEQASPRRWG